MLLAEDEESFLRRWSIGLTNEGFRVTVARDGNEALQLFDETVPDILLLDLMLPKLSGIDVCRAIRTRSHVPIIMVTAKGTEIDTVVALEIGADDYVTKPYRSRELVARMRGGAAHGRIGIRGPGRHHRVGSPVRMDVERHIVTVWPASRRICRARSSNCCACCRNSGRVLDPDAAHRPRSGAPTTSVTPRRSTYTSSGCAPRSSRTRPSPRHIVTVRGLGYKFEVRLSCRAAPDGQGVVGRGRRGGRRGCRRGGRRGGRSVGLVAWSGASVA